ncbi:acetylxylan esterase [Planosporangium flavigriseum]|uniref:Cephalosporin-C deacetylase n=1 Tax=Planosporangium flavigriseum TaxID=373681 RepID=A0A8J3PL41_9ACTN|nr:acetylxylan esterase [Planosporangium flavigriseum]NJC66599.1 acetylxylan esterase [Planosporangium flavigriseum]GIG73472.1 cephalosporin-C deacetylase [Planosporangium flavigriseum]
MFVDLPLDELREYRPAIARPDDFAEFWTSELAAARQFDPPAEFRPIDTPLAGIDVFDVTFPGYGGHPIRGWLLLPRQMAADAPVVVEFVGYNGGRGDPLEWLLWAGTGHPHFVMDNRGQGGGWRGADTADPADPGEPSSNGFLTKGIADPHRHYYVRLYVDAARAVDAVLAHGASAGRAVVTTGASQGGALALAAASLHDRVAVVLPDVPFLSHPVRAVQITDAKPYGELAEYCAVYPDRIERVFHTLSYFDVANHATRIRKPALFSVGLIDEITPPSTVFAAYNRISGERPKEIIPYPFTGHQGGGIRQHREKLRFLARLDLTA